jgi:hypothetical protein
VSDADADRRRYRDLVRDLPRPTPAQSAAFAQHVAGAHSWYKHLPPFPPGAPFTFFLDPNSGRTLLRTPSGESAFVDRVHESERFHYTWMPTREYRERFGHWEYATDRGTRLYVGSPRKGWQDLGPRAELLAPEGEWFAVPEPLARAGTCLLTALVHRHRAPWLLFRDETATAEFEARSRRGSDDPEVRRCLPLLRLAEEFHSGAEESPQRASPEEDWSRRFERFHESERELQLERIRKTLDGFLAALDA